MSSAQVKFSLKDVIDAIESASDDSQWYANVETGEVDVYIDPIFSGMEYDEGAFEGEEWLSLPDRFERDDWGMMRDFAYELGGSIEDELLDAIHGRGAFRNFRYAVERAGLLESWYAYKDERRCQMAIEWLEGNGCTWADDRHESQKRDWRELLPDHLKSPLRLAVLGCQLSVCQCKSVPAELLSEGFCCITRTDGEVSVVCDTTKAPADATNREDGWRALKVCGPLDFGLVGILAKISSTLADAGVPLFAVSTYDTDYVLVKSENLTTAIAALHDGGCVVDMP